MDWPRVRKCDEGGEILLLWGGTKPKIAVDFLRRHFKLRPLDNRPPFVFSAPALAPATPFLLPSSSSANAMLSKAFGVANVTGARSALTLARAHAAAAAATSVAGAAASAAAAAAGRRGLHQTSVSSSSWVVDDPFSGVAYTEVSLKTADEAKEQVRAAAAAQREFAASTTLADRIALVERFLVELQADADTIAEDIAGQMGRPVHQAKGEVGGVVERAEALMALAPEALGDDVSALAGCLAHLPAPLFRAIYCALRCGAMGFDGTG